MPAGRRSPAAFPRPVRPTNIDPGRVCRPHLGECPLLGNTTRTAVSRTAGRWPTSRSLPAKSETHLLGKPRRNDQISSGRGRTHSDLGGGVGHKEMVKPKPVSYTHLT